MTIDTKPYITTVACSGIKYEIVDEKAREDIEQIKRYLGLLDKKPNNENNSINTHDIYYKTNVEYIY